MKLRWDVFRGIRPRQSPTKLPPGYGQVATNVRARSDDLESWREAGIDRVLPKAGPIVSLFLMAREFWLHFAQDVEFARGPVPVTSNDEERTYITGLDCPRVTNLQMATTGDNTEQYPYRTIPIGVQAPADAPTVETEFIGAPQVVYTDDGSSLDGWTEYGNQSDINDPDDGVTVDGSTGDPQAPSFRFASTDLNDASRVGIFREIPGPSGSETAEIRFRYRFDRQPPIVTVLADEDRIGLEAELDLLPAGGFAEASIVMTLVDVGTYRVDLSVVRGPESASRRLAERFVARGDVFAMDVRSQDSAQPVGFITRTIAHLDTVSVQTTGDAESVGLTTYVSTYINELAEESAPSPASDLSLRSENSRNTVTVQEENDTKTTIYGHRLYRAATGATGTVFLLLHVQDYATPGNPTAQELAFVDEVADADLGELLESANWDTPPDDGHSILALPNGVMVMASGNQVVPSVRFRPHAYPVDFRLATDYNIVTLAALDSTVFALTESHAYQVIGDNPAALSMAKFGPPYACVSKRSVAYLSDIGFLYASPDGLVAGNTQRLWLISEPWITPREWRAGFAPETITAVAHDDIYFGFYDADGQRRGFVFDPAQDGFGFCPLDIAVHGVYADPLTDQLYFSDGKNLFLWEGGEGRLVYTWRSRKELLPYPNAFKVAQIDADSYEDLTMRFFADGRLFFEKQVTGPNEFRIPPADGRDFEVEVAGTDRVHSFEVADDVEELA